MSNTNQHPSWHEYLNVWMETTDADYIRLYLRVLDNNPMKVLPKYAISIWMIAEHLKADQNAKQNHKTRQRIRP